MLYGSNSFPAQRTIYQVFTYVLFSFCKTCSSFCMYLLYSGTGMWITRNRWSPVQPYAGRLHGFSRVIPGDFLRCPRIPCIPNSNPPANSKMTQHSTAHSQIPGMPQDSGSCGLAYVLLPLREILKYRWKKDFQYSVLFLTKSRDTCTENG